MPDAARMIIDKLYENGYEAYIVGGCVRDALLSKIADDYDITTNALPEDVKRIFERTVDTGIKHGTVTVICDGTPFEVTTYRVDGEYIDMRHPKGVTFTGRLTDDLARRDFTVNAIAYNDREGIVDAFGGISDLECGIIRAVGDPEVRFSEDALRILRGIRFASVLGFLIEDATANAIRRLAKNLTKVSKERIFVEWKKLLSGENAYKIIKEYFDVIKVFLPGARELSVSEENFMALSPDLRALALFAYDGGIDAFGCAAADLKMDSRTRDDGEAILKSLSLPSPSDSRALRRYLINKEDRIAISSATLAERLGLCEVGAAGEICRLIDKDVIRRINQLDIGGRDIMTLGIKGEAIGRALNFLLLAAALGDVENEREALLEYASQKFT